MAILIDADSEIVVQGITSREGRLRTNLMIDGGSKVVAGVTPGRGGETFRAGVPIYDTVAAAKAVHPGLAASLVIVPPVAAKDAVFEALASGIKLIHLMPERLPHHDTLDIIARARKAGAHVIC